MTTEMRKTGVDVVGDMPWGTHFCLFYETQSGSPRNIGPLLQSWIGEPGVLPVGCRRTPYSGRCHACIETSCSWLRSILADHSIEIVSARDWYLQDGTFDLKRVICGWNEKLARASARGYAGVRVTGDTAWLEKKHWKDFCEYEESLNQAIANQRLAVLCTYPLAACGAAEILDVVRTHQFAVTKRRGSWDVIETAGHKQAKAEIKRLNEELEQRVLERTSQLTSVNEELTKEVLERQRAVTAAKQAEDKIRQSESELRQILDFAPQHVAVLGPDRTRLYVNQAVLDYFGLTLEEWRSGDPRRFFHPDDWERMMSEAQSKFLSGPPARNRSAITEKRRKVSLVSLPL